MLGGWEHRLWSLSLIQILTLPLTNRWPWASYLSSLSLNFLVSKTGTPADCPPGWRVRIRWDNTLSSPWKTAWLTEGLNWCYAHNSDDSPLRWFFVAPFVQVMKLRFRVTQLTGGPQFQATGRLSSFHYPTWEGYMRVFSRTCRCSIPWRHVPA